MLLQTFINRSLNSYVLGNDVIVVMKLAMIFVPLLLRAKRLIPSPCNLLYAFFFAFFYGYSFFVGRATYHPRTIAKTSGATIEASDSMMYFGVVTPNFPQVIFSFGTAPE